MEFLSWHYSKGLEFYILIWKSLFTWVSHFFSLPLLLKTLFSPWKRLIDVDVSPGFSLQRKFEVFTFNLISRVVGATVRFSLFVAGIVFFIFTLLVGVFGFIFWMAFPFLGLGIYSKEKRKPVNFVQNLMGKLRLAKEKPLEIIFQNEAGQFLLNHIGIDDKDILDSAKQENVNLSELEPKNYSDIIRKLIEDKVWDDDFFNKKEIEKNDLVLVSGWWDQKRARETEITGEVYFGRPGIALELTFGYTPTLNKYSLDLSMIQPFSHRLIGRGEIVLRMERILTSGNSVLLMGQPGVGKKTVVLEFAHRATTGQFGVGMAFRRILELDHNLLLSETMDLNQKKTKFAQILAEAAYAGNIILMIRDIQRLTNPEVEGYDFSDVFDEFLEKRELKIIAVATNTDYERFIAPNMRLRKYLEKVEVTPPTKDEAIQILIESAQSWEAKRNLIITFPALRNILEESDRYITEVPFPEKALELLDAVVAFAEQTGLKIITEEQARTILAEKTGISFSKLSEEDRKKLGDIEKIIHERLINQDVAVSLIAKALRAKTAGVIKEDRPLGSFLFLGPTGVGKTETAKVLAKVYFGSEENILRFDMAEYSGREGLERLIGSVGKNQPGILTTSIKNRPASLLLLDEIEKAKSEVYNLFLSLLDEGFITDAFGKKIICRHLFVIGTSNAGAEFVRKLVETKVGKDELQKSVVNYVLENQIFSPEFLNRFDGVVVYEPLKNKDLVKIARLMFSDLKDTLRKKNILLDVSDSALVKLAKDGFEPAFGARPMRRLLNLNIGDLIGRSIIKGEIEPGDKIRIIPADGRGEFNLEEF